MKRVIENKQLIFVGKSKVRKQKAFQTDHMEIRSDCAERYHILCNDCMNFTNGILIGLRSVLSVIIFLLKFLQ